ncbi:MAG: hypothetical protein AAF959_02165 [Cyanobacteria bacterium P01_D01_bin.56]
MVTSQSGLRGPQSAEKKGKGFLERVRAADDRNRDAERLSGVALGRFERNCSLVIGSQSGKESHHRIGDEVIDPSTGFPLPPGVEVCNSRGWTAETDKNGAVSNVAIATRHDSNENGRPDLEDVRSLLNGQE